MSDPVELAAKGLRGIYMVLSGTVDHARFGISVIIIACEIVVYILDLANYGKVKTRWSSRIVF